MSYGIFLSFNNQAEAFQIPVNPESIEVTAGGNGKTYDIIGRGGGNDETRAGEISVIKNPKLREVSFNSLFPARVYPFVEVDYLFDPMHYIGLIERWKATKHPIRFIFAGGYSERMTLQEFSYKDLNFPASIEKFTWKESAGSPGDIEYSITLKEYVFYSARRVEVKTNADGEKVIINHPPKRPDERIRPDTYKLKKGETLLDVSMKFFETADNVQDSSRHKDIQKLNNLTDAQVQKLKEGDVPKIPPY